MDIEEFIQTTLTQIIDGVKKAQDATLMALKKHKTLPELQWGPEEDADMVNPRVMYSATPAPKGTKCLYGLLSTIILTLFKHGQTDGSQGHSSVPPEVYDSGIVPGISHSMPVAPSRPYWGFPPGKRRSPYEIWSC